MTDFSGFRLVQIVQGEYRISARPDEVLGTVLGSCVATCLWDEGAGIGGMNHFLLARSHDPGGGAGDVRYGVHAMEVLINALLRAGARRGELKAKLFGGAQINAALGDIGEANATFARGFLKDEGIPCLAESLGGTNARRLSFHPATGRARQLQIPANLARDPPPVPAPPPARRGTDIQLF